MSDKAGRSPCASPLYDSTERHSGPHVFKNFVQQIIEICDSMMTVIQAMEETGQCRTDAELAKNSEQSSPNQEYLRKKLKELIDMNVQWQTSFANQSEQIARLKKELAELQQRQLTERQQAGIDNVILAQKDKYRLLEDEKNKFEDENRRLRREVESLKTRLTGLGRTQTDVERVEMLEMQLATYVEDFERERRDRERAQGKVAELEQELEALRRKPMSTYEPYMGSAWSSSSVLTSRGTALYQTDAHDGPDESDSAPSAASRLPVSRSTDQDLLHCPQCHAAFTKDQHFDLMEHLERCA